MHKTQKQLQSEQTREQIIRTATQLFARRGFHGTSMSDLAAAAGLTKGAFYHHFESKDALFFAVVDSVREKWQRAVEAEVRQAQDPLEQLSILLTRHAELLRQEPTMCLVISGLSAEMQDTDPVFTDALHGVYLGFIAFVESIVRSGQTSGQMRLDIDPRLVAVNIVGHLRGVSCFSVLDRLGLDCVTAIEAIKPVLLDGLRAT